MASTADLPASASACSTGAGAVAVVGITTPTLNRASGVVALRLFRSRDRLEHRAKIQLNRTFDAGFLVCGFGSEGEFEDDVGSDGALLAVIRHVELFLELFDSSNAALFHSFTDSSVADGSAIADEHDLLLQLHIQRMRGEG